MTNQFVLCWDNVVGDEILEYQFGCSVVTLPVCISDRIFWSVNKEAEVSLFASVPVVLAPMRFNGFRPLVATSTHEWELIVYTITVDTCTVYFEMLPRLKGLPAGLLLPMAYGAYYTYRSSSIILSSVLQRIFNMQTLEVYQGSI